MDDYVSKPVNSATLQKAIEKWMKPNIAPSSCDTPADQSVREPECPPAEGQTSIDVPMLISRCFDNPTFALSMLDEFQRSSQENIGKIEDAVAEGSNDAVAAAAHALQRRCRNPVLMPCRAWRPT